MKKFAALAVIAGTFALAGCAQPKATLEFDYPQYSTVADLNAHADAMVIGTVGELIGTEVDNGGDPAGDGEAPPGVPMAFYNFNVDTVVRGDVPATITVAWLDQSQLNDPNMISTLAKGQHLVLWLIHRTSEEMPGIHSVKDVWVPLSGDNAVMDVTDGQATARSPLLTGLDRAPEEAGRPLTIELSQLVRFSASD